MDVHKRSVMACAITPEGWETRRFGAATGQLPELADWLAASGVSQAATESDRVYWKPVDNLLEDEFTVRAVNAVRIKQVPGRKTGVRDAERIAGLLQHGLLRASPIPDRAWRELRELTRCRRSLVQERRLNFAHGRPGLSAGTRATRHRSSRPSYSGSPSDTELDNEEGRNS